jgi:hypothetical protein
MPRIFEQCISLRGCILEEKINYFQKEGTQAKNNTKKKTRIFTTNAEIIIIRKSEN